MSYVKHHGDDKVLYKMLAKHPETQHMSLRQLSTEIKAHTNRSISHTTVKLYLKTFEQMGLIDSHKQPIIRDQLPGELNVYFLVDVPLNKSDRVISTVESWGEDIKERKWLEDTWNLLIKGRFESQVMRRWFEHELRQAGARDIKVYRERIDKSTYA